MYINNIYFYSRFMMCNSTEIRLSIYIYRQFHIVVDNVFFSY